MNLELNDLIKLCVILDMLITKRRAEDEAYLARIKDTPISQLQAQFIVADELDLEDLCDLRDRLFAHVPEHML
jgi:hypothetical protein